MRKNLFRNLSILGVSVIVLVNLFVSLSSDTSKKYNMKFNLLTALASEYGGSGSGSGGYSTEMYTHICPDLTNFSRLCEPSNYPEEPCTAFDNVQCADPRLGFVESGRTVAYARETGCINDKGEEVCHRWVSGGQDIIQCFWCGLWYSTRY